MTCKTELYEGRQPLKLSENIEHKEKIIKTVALIKLFVAGV